MLRFVLTVYDIALVSFSSTVSLIQFIDQAQRLFAG